ncbi:MAG: SufE family protein [Alphaproteobacteria bacterium]|nr:SufE family protein [Alphaproteobacteria bacterium SS10]
MALPTDFDDLVETLEFLDDWEERYRFIIDLGKDLEPLPEAAYADENKVKGCMSQVWMTYDKREIEGQAVIHFAADSDAHIVKGLIAVLIVLFSDKTPEQILAVDIDAAFAQLQLEEHLSPNRRNGFFSMIDRIKTVAALAQAA